MKYFFRRIKTKLTFWLVLIAILPLAIVSVITYEQRAAATKEREFNKLMAVRDLKARQLNTWLEERIGDLNLISRDSRIRGSSSGIISGNNSPDALNSLRDILILYKDNYSFYEEISIMHPQTGDVAVSTETAFEGEDRYNRLYFSEPLRTTNVYISDIYFSSRLNRPAMMISLPVFFKTHNRKDIAGVLLCSVDLRQTQDDLFMDRTGLGSTGEIFIVNSDAIVLSELKWAAKAPLNLRLSDKAAVESARGLSGIAENIDYRGEKVLSAYTSVPLARWGIIVKQDLAEINEPLYRMLFEFIIILLCATGAVYLAASLISRKLFQPVVEMTNTSKRIQEGDLSARNVITGRDELGYLAKTINNLADFMVGRIKIQHSSAEIIETIATVDEVSDFRKKLLLKLMEISSADFGAYYRLNKDDNRFYLFTSMGVNVEALLPFDAKTSEGVFSIALINKRIEHIREIPQNSRFVFKTLAGDITPSEIITIPLIIEGEVRGIVSLGKIAAFSALTMEVFSQTWQSINNALSNLLAHIETRRLADELNEKNLELIVKSEELQKQAAILEKQSDILRRQNIELEGQRRQVEEANRLKSEFLSNMSHELRTPLNSILALSRVLIMQAGEKLSDDERNYLNIIDRNGKNLLNLINDILDLSKIEAGKVEVNARKFSLGPLIASIVENIEPVAEEKSLRIIREIPEGLHDINSDESLVRQILQNIISNAVKFTEKGTVRISVLERDGEVVVEVQDTGIGISGKNLPHIFDEFWQADGSNTRKYDGTGLGLSISYKAARCINARIDAESELGRGSIFRVVIPVQWSDDGEFAGFPALGRESGPKRKILIIDDNPEIAAAVSRYLREEGCEALSSVSGMEALEIARSEKPFAILLDILMPDMDGWEILEKLKNDKETSDIPVIIISALDNIDTGLVLGAAGFIQKPVRRERLVEELNKLQSKKRRIILVADDNEIDRGEMSRVIRENNMDVITAGGGNECLEILDNAAPDAVVLDLMLPDTSGFEVLKKIRMNQATAEMPVIVVTAKDLTAADKKRLNGNVSAVILKTDLTFKSLIKEIRKIFSRIDDLPRSGAVRGQESPVGRISPVPGAGKAGAKRSKILIIEDNIDNMVTARAVLGGGYDIIEATDGEAGLNMIFQRNPDLVLLDILLPNLSGYDVLKRVRTSDETRNIPVIAMTAHAMKGDREKLMAEGCDDYISKPINPDELTEKVRRILSNHEPEEHNGYS